MARPPDLEKKWKLDVELGGNPRHEPAIAIIRGMMRLLPSDRSTLKETGDMLEEMAMFFDHEEWDENFFEGYQNWNGPDDSNDSDVEDEERSARTLCPSLESLTVESSEGCDAASLGKSDAIPNKEVDRTLESNGRKDGWKVSYSHRKKIKRKGKAKRKGRGKKKN